MHPTRCLSGATYIKWVFVSLCHDYPCCCCNTLLCALFCVCVCVIFRMADSEERWDCFWFAFNGTMAKHRHAVSWLTHSLGIAALPPPPPPPKCGLLAVFFLFLLLFVGWLVVLFLYACSRSLLLFHSCIHFSIFYFWFGIRLCR